ncbi:MAG TPA: FtsQ-type POTRA domain-containing protein [Actinomycetota bacterium]|nr:FtsQ-type POTRA domain-containing protein [Actinomycetota bacterium]
MRAEAGARRRPWGGIVTLTVIAMAVGAWAVASSPVFHIRDVKVKGNRHLSDSEVVRLAGIGADANLLTFPTERVARSLMRNPWIRRAEVSRSFPSTLILTIEERSEVAWVRHPNGVAVVAADGTVLNRRRKPPKALVAIGRSGRPLRPGAVLEGLEEPLAVAASLAPRLRGQVERASLEEGQIVLHLVDGTRILYGQAGSLPEKNAALAKVLRWAGKQGADLAYVDLRVAGNPAVKVRRG